jgi:hypothetical protein
MLSDVLEKLKELRAMPPVAIEFWFIDRPTEYFRILDLVQEWPPTTHTHLPAKVRLFNKTLDEFKALHVEIRHHLKIPAEPGIYAKMSDGSDEPLATPAGAEEGEVMG